MNQPKKNLLLLIPVLGFGGAQQVFHDHSVELAKEYNVFECVFNKDHGVYYPTGNELIDLNVPAGSNFFSKIYFFLLRCFRLRKVKKKYNIDISISHLEGADYVNILSKAKEKIIFVIHGSKVHDKEIKGLIGWFQRNFFMPFFYKLPDKIVTVSRDIRLELINHIKLSPSKIITINNFFYPEEVLNKANQPVGSKYDFLFSDNSVIVTSGRLAVQKNQAPLLDIFSKVLSIKKCKLVFLGDGGLRQKLVDHAINLGLRVYKEWDNNYLDNDYDVYFLGYQKNPFKFIKRSTIFAFPSGWEGFPMALGEAMICGVPVVSTDCPTGPREMLSPSVSPSKPIREAEFGEYGILLPLLNNDFKEIGSLDVWTLSLLNLLEDETLRKFYGEQAVKRMSDFTRDKVFVEWKSLFEKL